MAPGSGCTSGCAICVWSSWCIPNPNDTRVPHALRGACQPSWWASVADSVANSFETDGMPCLRVTFGGYREVVVVPLAVAQPFMATFSGLSGSAISPAKVATWFAGLKVDVLRKFLEDHGGEGFIGTAGPGDGLYIPPLSVYCQHYRVHRLGA